MAALAAIETLLSATVADGMTVDQRHDPDRELFGQGIANLAAPLFGGVAATGAIARTAVNVRAGAASRLAALTHAAVLVVVIYTAGAARLEDPTRRSRRRAAGDRDPHGRGPHRSSRSPARPAPTPRCSSSRSLVTVAVDLITAVAVGVGVAVTLALRAIARQVRVDQVPLDQGDHTEEEHALLAEHIVAYRIDGPLFFAAAHRFLLELSEVADVRVVILRMSRVTTMDATGALVLGDAIAKLERRDIAVLLSGIRPSHNGVLSALGVADHLRRDGRVFEHTPAAIEYARSLTHA